MVTLLPGPIQKVLNYTASRIEEVLDEDQWDEATAFLIDTLKDKRERKSNPIMGMKYLCDTKEHIEAYEKNSIYKVVKNSYN